MDGGDGRTMMCVSRRRSKRFKKGRNGNAVGSGSPRGSEWFRRVPCGACTGAVTVRPFPARDSARRPQGTWAGAACHAGLSHRGSIYDLVEREQRSLAILVTRSTFSLGVELRRLSPCARPRMRPRNAEVYCSHGWVVRKRHFPNAPKTS